MTEPPQDALLYKKNNNNEKSYNASLLLMFALSIAVQNTNSLIKLFKDATVIFFYFSVQITWTIHRT